MHKKPVDDGRPIDNEGPFVVIGANGFLGSEICIQLRKRDKWATIVAPVRSLSDAAINPRLEGLKIRFVEARYIDEGVLRRCVFAAHNMLDGDRIQCPTGMTEDQALGTLECGIFHVAGHTCYSTAETDLIAMMESNTVLCDVVFAFAAKFHIRTVYASCSAVVGCQGLKDRLVVAHDDSDPSEADIADFPFLQQKRNIELKWREEALKGRAPIVFLRPSTLLGPGDEKLRSTHCVFELLHGKTLFPMNYGGGISFVDVRDVAVAFVLAMFSTVLIAGSAVNLTAANLPTEEFVRLVSDTLRISPSLWPFEWTRPLPSGFLRLLNGTRLFLKKQLFGMSWSEREQPMYLESRLRYYNVTCQRAKAALRWDPRDPEETIEDTARFMADTFGEKKFRGKHRGTKTRGVIEYSGIAVQLQSSSWKMFGGNVKIAVIRLRLALLMLCVVIALFATAYY